MARYLDPKSDLVFKKIFGTHPNLLKDFLNAILPLPYDCSIESLSYLPTENTPEIPCLKHSIVDVLCVDNHDRTFIVELQLQWSKYFIQRMLFNTAATYVHQLQRAESYQHLSPFYGLAVIDALFTDEEEWFHHYRMAKADDPNKSLEEIQLVLIELPKLKPTTVAEKKLAVLWLRFLKETNDRTEEVDAALLTMPSIKEALRLTEVSAYNAAELRAYNKNWDAIRSEKTLLIDKFDEGLAKGLAEGTSKVIKNMHRSGFSIDQICTAVGLPESEVQDLISSI
jgi:predicted transposase/invertase (TIGR01784 family)